MNSKSPSLKTCNRDEPNIPLRCNTEIEPEDYLFEQNPTNYGYGTPAQIAFRIGNGRKQASFMHINCRSINYKTDEVQLLLQQLPVEVLAITETWLTPEDKIQIPGYDWVYKPRDFLDLPHMSCIRREAPMICLGLLTSCQNTHDKLSAQTWLCSVFVSAK